MTKKNLTLKQASHLIQSAHRPLLICHVTPDGDAVGSLTALARALRYMGQQPIAACADPIPNRFNHVPGVEAIERQFDSSFDLVIALDCSDPERLGPFSQSPGFESAPLLNIDHHVTNLNFGSVNLIDPTASSTSEIILRLLNYLAVPLDAELATSLLTGMVTDTRGFRTSNVTPRVMEAALQLMEAGASLPHITHHVLDRRSIAAVRLWGEAMSQLRLQDRIVWTGISLAMRCQVGYAGNGDAGLASFLIGAEEADVAAVFVEREDDRIEVGLRAAPGFDVAQVALQFGGGGHALAAGCHLFGSLGEVQRRVLDALRTDLARQRRSREDSPPVKR